MSAKDKILKLLADVKANFAAPDVAPGDVAPAATSTPAPMIVSYGVDGGNPVFVDCSDDGIPDIDGNDKVYADPALSAPYPDGTYNVTGTDFGFTVASGLVTTVVDPDGSGPGLPLPADGSVPPPAPITAAVPPPPTMEQRVAAIEEALAKIPKPAPAPAPAAPLGMASEKDLEEANKKIEKYGKTIEAIFSLIGEMANVPTADPKTLTGNKKESFTKREKAEDKMSKIGAAIKDLKKY